MLDKGTLEAQQLSKGAPRRDLKRESEEAEHARSEIFKGHFEKMAIAIIWILFVGFLSLGGIWAFHLCLPKLGWLPQARQDDIKDLLTGGIIAGLIADHVRRRMS